ncbi:TIGR01777 family oxidoreductase [Roseivirga pacifica]|uniref:TIGR01777 family oxidoreductase n=1 Tax=Roseivirga pacifica TaxID=1267423 RepID=UPI003BB1ACA7
MNKKVLITGGTGLVGSELIPMLQATGWQVAVLSRSKDASAPYEIFEWDYHKDYIEEGAFNNVSAIIHLAGASVAGQRWTAERKEEIFNSRTKTSHLLFKKLNETEHEVKTFVTASAIGYYGNDTGNATIKESAPVGHDFLAHVTDAWETATSRVSTLGIRLVQLRIGVVLSQKSGALMELIKPPITAPLGKGNQYMSWIHIEDLCRMFMHALEEEKCTGAYNAVGPKPTTNKALTKAAASAFGKPFMPIPVPKLALKIFLGEMAQIVLGGSRISCEKIMTEGFEFKFPKLEEALKDLKSR